MIELQGIPVSPGVVIAPALVLDAEGYRIPRCQISVEEVTGQRQLLKTAVAAVGQELEERRLSTTAAAGASTGDIFAAQLQMLNDPRLHAELHRRMTIDLQSAAMAVSGVLHSYAASLRQLTSPLLADRAQDVLDIERQLLTHLGVVTARPLAELTEAVIVLAHLLTPSETANLDRELVHGFCTEVGGPGGHTAIVAKGLELPAVVGIGNFLQNFKGSDCVIVDGDRGRLIIDPSDEVLEQYRQRVKVRATLARRLAKLSTAAAETTDGVRIGLMANIEFPHETAAALHRGADGIGLYRTEFLYLSSDTEPSEEDHVAAYRKVIADMRGRPVVIRTLDLGADKVSHRSSGPKENNPFLGLRSIRLSLRNLNLFRPQLRAVLRAAVDGDVRVMFPLITTIGELRQARMVLKVVADDLAEDGTPHRADIPVGMMVEVPAAVMMLEHFAAEVDFFSIGTNDLAQYTLAVDRSNESVAELYQSSDPAVLRLIQQTVDVAAATDTPLSVCGEMSSMPGRALLLLGLGVRSLSVPPSAVPRIKKAIRSVSIDQCEAIAARVAKFESARDVDLYLLDRLGELVPELIVA